jgi:pseudaminic acid cytidylyltransferase
MKIAIIPARAGSKRIKNKNIKFFIGKPIIAYSIEAAIKTKMFDSILVSTDSEEIAEIAQSYGAITPFIRPANLSDDHTKTIDVVIHSLQKCTKFAWNIRYACCIYPCNPFLNENDIIATFEILSSLKECFVYPVSLYPHPTQRAMRKLADGSMELINPIYETFRTQDLEKSYHDAGQFYWGSLETWLTSKKIHSNGIGYPIPKWRAVDIDNDEDWVKAEYLYKIMKDTE